MNTLNKLERWILAYVFVTVLLGVYLAIFNQPYFDQSYTIEDGFLEWLTVIGLTATASVCTARVIQLAGHRSPLFLLVTALVALLFFCAAGEEISWGQRLFNVQSSEFFRAHNAQSETNLHNLVVDGTKVNKLIFGRILGLVFACYFLVLTPLYHKNKKIAAWVNALGIPIPKWQHLVSYFLVLILIEGVIHHFSPTLKRGEMTECAIAFIVFLNVYSPFNEAIFLQRH